MAEGYTYNYTSDTPMMRTWDGTPFVVDVSSRFSNADELLDAVAYEARRIEVALGYPVFVAGDILPLEDISETEELAPWLGFPPASRGQPTRFIPPDGHVHVRCCHDEPDKAGTAHASWRHILLQADPFQARHVIIHELWHMLGFAHLGETGWIEMSHTLMYGDGGLTSSTAEDFGQLACIMEGEN